MGAWRPQMTSRSDTGYFRGPSVASTKLHRADLPAQGEQA